MADLATTDGAMPTSLLDMKSHSFPSWISGAILLVALLGGVG